MSKKILIKLFLLLFTALSFASENLANPGPEWIGGEIIRVQQSKNIVVLKHEKIPSVCMDAMTMPFEVNGSVALNKFAAGDKIRFQVKIIDKELIITSMEKKK